MKLVTFTGEYDTAKAFLGKAVAIETKFGGVRNFGKITKITPKGFMDVTFKVDTRELLYRFNADGIHVGGGYVERIQPDRLVTVESARKDIKDKELAEEAAKAISNVKVVSTSAHSLQAMLEQLDILQNKLNEARLAVLARLNEEAGNA